MSAPKQSASVSIEELVRRCEWVMRSNERMLLDEGRIDPDFYFGRGEGDLLYELRFDLLANWMNSGFHKEFLFSMVRHGVEAGGFDCVIFASDVWRFKADKPVPEDLRREGIERLESLGYGKRYEAVCVTGQTREHSVIMARQYFRDALNPDKVFHVSSEDLDDRLVGSIESYGGRTKMFGDWREPGMREAYESVGKSIKRSGAPILEVLQSSLTLVNIAVDEP